MNLKSYIPIEADFWTGRVDDLHDVDSFRMHQIIKLLDLKELQNLKLDPSKLDICLIGYCCDEGIERNLGRTGAKHGPNDIRGKFASLPVPLCDKIQIYDAGNLSCENGTMEEIQEQLAIAIEQMLDHHLFPVVLGGSHDLAYGHFNGIVNHFRKQSKKINIGIINFDAHFDIRPYDTQSSSGTMFSQIADNCAKDEQEFNYLCLGIQPSGNTRSLFNKADSLGVKYVLASEFVESDPDTISAKIKTFINDNDYIYLTLCGDVFSSSSAPGVSAMQPFGLDPNYVLRYTKEILQTQKVISFDIAEVSPPLDDDKRTARLAANILYAVIEGLCG